MAKYTIESRYCSTFGMDVHARTTTVKGIDGSTAATAAKRFDDVPAPSEIASWMQGEFTGPWYAAYESGCTGFHLCRELRALGVDCDVVAATSIARSDADRKRKNDRLWIWRVAADGQLARSANTLRASFALMPYDTGVCEVRRYGGKT